jgi:hypothetical protein
MQANSSGSAVLDVLERHGPPGMSREFAAQLVSLLSAPARRYSSDELFAFATTIDKGFSRRTLADWPKWGLLALATTSGRGPNEGVERSWSANEVQVFLMVVRKRLEGQCRRAALANIPVFMWLLLGPEHVPHEQVRRALATWTRAAQSLSTYRTVTDNYHAVLRRPRVQELVEQGAIEKKELHARAEAAPSVHDLEGRARYLGGFGPPNGFGIPTPDEINEMTRRHTRSLKALQHGMDQLPTANDSLLDVARNRYRGSKNLDFLPDLDADPRAIAAAVASPRFKTEGETACSNALTFLGVVCQERDPPNIGVDKLLRAGQQLATELVGGARSAYAAIERILST